MSRNIPCTEPRVFVAGDSWRWRRELRAYPPSDGWLLRYVFTGATKALQVDAAADGAGHLVTVPPSSSADTPAGDYRLVGQLLRGADADLERVTLVVLPVVVQPDYGTATTTTSQLERTLAAIESAIERRVALDLKTFSELDRAATREELETLVRLRGIYASRVHRRRHPTAGLPSYHVRF